MCVHHLGASLLRTQALKEARALRERGEITAEKRPDRGADPQAGKRLGSSRSPTGKSLRSWQTDSASARHVLELTEGAKAHSVSRARRGRSSSGSTRGLRTRCTHAFEHFRFAGRADPRA